MRTLYTGGEGRGMYDLLVSIEEEALADSVLAKLDDAGRVGRGDRFGELYEACGRIHANHLAHAALRCGVRDEAGARRNVQHGKFDAVRNCCRVWREPGRRVGGLIHCRNIVLSQ